MGLSSMSDHRHDLSAKRETGKVIPFPPRAKSHFSSDEYDEYEDRPEVIWPWFAIGGAIVFATYLAHLVHKYVGWDFMGRLYFFS